MRIAAYVDGFSVYNSCFKGPTKAAFAPYKWLDYRALLQAVFPEDDVVLVRVFTAIAPHAPGDQDQPTRHNTYVRALRCQPRTEVYVGRFQKSKREAVLLRPPDGVDAAQTVSIYQEKQSDVALASYLLLDAFDGVFERAVILTNDSDFLPPIRLVRERFGREVVVVSPGTTLSGDLRKAVDHGQVLDKGLLAVCQLPNPVLDGDGREIFKPRRWHVPESAT